MLNRRKTAAVEANALEDKLLEFVRQTGINLTPDEQKELAKEYYNMIIGWIEQPDDSRSKFLGEQGKRIINRFTSGNKVYALELVGHFKDSSAGQEEAQRHASTFFERFVHMVQHIFHRTPPRFQPSAEFHRPSISSMLVESQGKAFKIKANITVKADMPKKVIRQAKARTDRRGQLKIERFSFDERQLSFQGEGFIREETAV
jgi:hypothetical protein